MCDGRCVKKSGATHKKHKKGTTKFNETSVPKSIVFPDCDRVQNRKSLLPRRETDKKTNEFKTRKVVAGNVETHVRCIQT